MIKSQLENLVQQNKFKDEVWIERGLNPSDSDLCIALEKELNAMLQNLLLQENSFPSAKIEILNTSLQDFEKYDLDSVEKELVADYFATIADIIKVEINKNLDIWLYGFDTNERIISKPLNVFKSISSPCQKCNNKLATDILKERENVEPFWLIVQCNNCNEFNLLEFEENIDRYKIGDYFIFESIKKSVATVEDAIEKMNFYKAANTI